MRDKKISTLPFAIDGFEIEQAEVEANTVWVRARSTARTGCCPNCEVVSSTSHGWHQRLPQELPSVGKTVRLMLIVRRFRCLNPMCAQKTFVERFAEWLPPYARRTTALTEVIRRVGFESGGESGARVLDYIQVVASADTVLRVIRLAALSPRDAYPLRQIGIDDWAIKKGRTYGTIIVDLEQHQVVDVLPDRTAETVAQWLQAHPSIEVITRDRSTDYINGIQAGAPTALQVADRWHLLLNLSQMVERFLGTIHNQLRAVPMSDEYRQALQEQRAAFRRTQAERRLSQLSRDRRVARYEQVQQWRREGYNITQIARILNCKWETARDYFDAPQFPERQQRSLRHSIIDPLLPYLEKRHAEGCENASQLWREIQKLGYAGSNKPVLRWMQQRRTKPAASTPLVYRETTSAEHKTTPSLPSAKQLAWVIVKDPAQLANTEHLTLAHIQQVTTVATVYYLAQQFVVMIKQRQVERLDHWLTACATSGITQLQSFARGIQQDYAAIHAALATSWSNGQTEGQVNRLKFIKRQMYGRARFDLLRLRVLGPTSST